MNRLFVLVAGVVFAIAGQANAELLTNGDFEAGLDNWASYGSGSGSGNWGYLWWSGWATVESSGGSDGGQYPLLDATGMQNYMDSWGWLWLGVWQPTTEGGDAGEWVQTGTTGTQLNLAGYANDLDQWGTTTGTGPTVNFFLEWKDEFGQGVDLNGDGEWTNEGDRSLVQFPIAGDGTWEHFETQYTVPEVLGFGTITQARVFVGFIETPIRMGLDQLSVSLVIDDESSADFDGDGDVDGDDFLAWQDGFGTPSGAMKSDGDYDNDGDVDGDDFLGWQDEFGSGSGAASAAVPEPASILLLIAALVGWVFVRRRN